MHNVLKTIDDISKPTIEKATLPMNLTLGLEVGGYQSGASSTPPIASGTFAPPAGIDGTAYSYDTSVLFTGGAVVTYSVATGVLPSGLLLNTSSGLISGTPDTVETAAGISITGTNADGSSTTNTASIAIAISAPIASGTFAPPAGEVNTAYSYATSTLFTGGAVASYSLNGTLPTGLSLNTSSGLISGTPTTEQTLTNISVTGTNATDSDTTNTASIAIAAEVTGVTVGMQPISDGTLDSELLAGSTQPDLTVSTAPVDGNSSTVTSSTLTLPSVSPDIIIFDDFSDETIGVSPDLNATIGTWESISNAATTSIYTGRSHGKGLYTGTDRAATYPIYELLLSNEQDIFVSYAYRVTTWPGTWGWPISPGVPEAGVYPNDSAWKLLWLFSEVDVYDSRALQSNLCVPTYPTEDSFVIGGNSHSMGGTLNAAPHSSFTSWNMYEAWLEADSTPTSALSEVRSSFTSDLGYQSEDIIGNLFASDDDSPTWKQMSIPGWIDSNDSDDMVYDDIYVADSPARVVVGNHPNRTLCTKAAIQTITGIAAGVVSFTWRLGDIDPDTELMYLFVYNETNTLVNSTGKLVNGGIL